MSACPRGQLHHCHRYLTRLSDRPASQVSLQCAAGVANACSVTKFVYVYNMSNMEIMFRLEGVLRDAASRAELHPEQRLSADELIALRNTHGGASCSRWCPLETASTKRVHSISASCLVRFHSVLWQLSNVDLQLVCIRSAAGRQLEYELQPVQPGALGAPG